MGTERNLIIKHEPYSLNELYDKFAGMLLGYIGGIVNDAKLAEQHLVSIFNSLPKHLDDLNAEGCNAWCHLQRLAQKHLAGFNSIVIDDTTRPTIIDLSSYYNRNRFLGSMNEEQKQVFCYVYYKGKTTAQVATDFGRTEESVRKALKGAIAIIRKGS